MVKLNLKKEMDFWIGGLLILAIYPFVRFAAILLRRNHQLNQPRHIVFIKMLGGGSLSMLFPCILGLRQKYPHLKISLICNRSILHFAKSYQLFDEVKSVQDQSLLKLVWSGLQLLLWLARSADVTIDLEIHSRLTTVFTTMALVKNRIGLINHNSIWRKRLYTHSLYVNSVKNLSEVYDSILGLFGIESVSVLESRKYFSNSVSQKSIPADFLPFIKNNKVISLGIGCSDLALERQLPDSLWLQLMQNLLDQNKDLVFLFLGGKDDEAIASRLKPLIENHQDRVLSLCGKVDVATSVRCIQSSALFIGIDSALIHLARLVGTPSVSFWGPTSPESLLRPLPLTEFIFNQNVHCSPCVHFTETPPCLGQNFCMDHKKNILLAVEKIQNYLNNGATNPVGLATEKITKVWAYYPDQLAPQSLQMKVRYV